MFALRASTAYLIFCAHQKGVAAKNARGRSSARGAENEVWSLQANDHTQNKLNDNTHLPYEILLAMCFSACDMQIKSCSSSATN